MCVFSIFIVCGIARNLHLLHLVVNIYFVSISSIVHILILIDTA